MKQLVLHLENAPLCKINQKTFLKQESVHVDERGSSSAFIINILFYSDKVNLNSSMLNVSPQTKICVRYLFFKGQFTKIAKEKHVLSQR